jgi:hypothetical protein
VEKIFVGSSLQIKKYKCNIKSVWITTAWQCISTEVTVKGVKQGCISNVIDKTNNDSCGMAVQRMGMSGMSARKMKALTMKIEAVTPIGNNT